MNDLRTGPFLAKRSTLVLAAIAFVFAYATIRLGAPADGIWNSPDETANAFWSARAAAFEPLKLPDEAVALGNGAVHPRSFGIAAGALVPGSFPGLFLLYGALHGLTRMPLHWMTPLATACAGLMLFALWQKVFDRRTAFLSAVLFFAHPGVLYYASRGLFHNLLFLDLAVAAAWCFSMRPLRAPWGDACGGLLLGLAVTTRASEAVWLLPAAAAMAALVPFQEARKRLPAALVGFALGAAVLLVFNAMTYGGPLRTSYVPPAPAIATAAEAPAATPASFLLPFGFHPANVLRHVASYGLSLFWWYTAALAFGVVWTVRSWRGWNAAARRYAIVALAVAAWLAILYGSWYVRDHWDPTRVTIGTSYVRYFLPAYVAALPAVAGGALFALRRLKFVHQRAALAAFLGLMAFLSIRLAVYEGDESLMSVRASLAAHAQKKPNALAALPEGAVIVTERFDKILFPERLRVIPSTDAASFAAAARLAASFDAYYYGPVLPADLQEALERRARAAGLTFSDPTFPADNEVVYRLRPNAEPL